MTKDKTPLGKGLGSLLGDRPKQQNAGLTEIPTEDLTPGQYQPRKKMYRDTLEELAQSIKQQGVIQPLVVRRLASGRYEIVVGERRWRAAQMAGLTTVPAVVRDLNNNETAKIALIENLQREDLNALDQARGLQRLQKEFNLSQESLGEAVGKSRTAVANLLRLLKLSFEVQELLEQGKLEMGHARALLSLDENQQIVFAAEIIKKRFSVRETEKYVSVKKSKNTPLTTTTSKDPNTISLEREVSEILGATTEIKHNKQGRGKMVIRYKSLDILQGILEKIKN
ncbi:MAG TPA: ParB/RepB/Spo0J family partition protein [Gammaproteobacteria bacterium]|jgi:ParB family chromosome partitioning protein|nr:ParB/RepB/Spo0J family partition protein [Gammaproteobacteria bacterium]